MISNVCVNPVFVIGSPRSGTSILPWALHQHSRFWTSRESDLLWHLFGRHYPGEQRPHLDEVYRLSHDRPEGTWLSEQKVDEAEFYACIGLGVNVLVSSRSHPRRWVDQTPLNTLMVHQLAKLFPGAQFVHILRDGRSVVHSMLNFAGRLSPELQASMQSAGSFPDWAASPIAAARTWVHFVTAAMKFAEAHPNRCMTIRNEALAADSDAGFRRLFEFLDEADEPASSTYFRGNRINSSFEGRAAPDPQPWLNWPKQWRQTYFEVAGHLTANLGYESIDQLTRWAAGGTA